MNMKRLTLSNLRYVLPPGLIAQKPLDIRSASRLLAVDMDNGSFEDTSFDKLDKLLRPGDLLVLNNTKVFRARLSCRKTETGGKAEIFLLKELEEHTWKVIIRPGRTAKPEMRLDCGNGLYCVVTKRLNQGRAIVRFESAGDTGKKIKETAQVPLPPYIKRDPEELDNTRYQTVFASETGAVAAPTAGLHFTPALLDNLKNSGIDNVHVTLHVGPGTFQPLRLETLEENTLEPEEYHIPEESLSIIRKTKRAGGRIIAVGTTTTRLLESIDIETRGPISGETEIFIFPPYKFRNVDALITNFHLPESSLLSLVAAFMGYELMMKVYQHAIEESYRFYSYGDAMLIEKESGK